MMSRHAKTRCQQRSIPPMFVDLLLRFGVTERAPGKADKVFLNKAARKQIKAYAGPLASQIDQHLDIYAIVSEEGSVVTIGHRKERVRRH